MPRILPKALFVYQQNYIKFFAFAVALTLVACAGAEPPAPASHMPLGASTSAPMGAVLFCEQNSSECGEARATPREVAMTPEKWADLRAVQTAVDRRIAPSQKADMTWHYADGGAGNCVQYALEKRRDLIGRGWPAGALQLATVVTPNNNRHLVLVVATNDGDWVLDNLRADVARWDDLPYHWTARQQGASLRDWVSIGLRG